MKKLIPAITDAFEKLADSIVKLLKIGSYGSKISELKKQMYSNSFGGLKAGDTVYMLHSDSPKEMIPFVLSQQPQVNNDCISITNGSEIFSTAERKGHGRDYLLASRSEFYNSKHPRKVFIVFINQEDCEKFIHYLDNSNITK